MEQDWKPVVIKGKNAATPGSGKLHGNAAVNAAMRAGGVETVAKCKYPTHTSSRS